MIPGNRVRRAAANNAGHSQNKDACHASKKAPGSTPEATGNTWYKAVPMHPSVSEHVRFSNHVVNNLSLSGKM